MWIIVATDEAQTELARGLGLVVTSAAFLGKVNLGMYDVHDWPSDWRTTTRIVPHKSRLRRFYLGTPGYKPVGFLIEP
jgi:hypothetical protein